MGVSLLAQGLGTNLASEGNGFPGPEVSWPGDPQVEQVFPPADEVGRAGSGTVLPI